MTDEKRIVEINGIKVEVDLRTAKRVDTYKVGDGIKVLVKTYSSYESHFGMVVGFDQFETLPTLIVCYLDGSRFSDSPLKFVYLNAQTKDIEICAHSPEDLGVQKADIDQSFEREINKRRTEVSDLEQKQKYFTTMFGRYFK